MKGGVKVTIEKHVNRVSLSCRDKDKKFNYTFSGIVFSASDEQIYELAITLNSVQDTTATQITRTTTTMLIPIE